MLESGGFKYFKLKYYAATQLRCQDECDDEKSLMVGVNKFGGMENKLYICR